MTQAAGARICDVGGLVVIMSGIGQWLPMAVATCAGLLACAWYCIEIWESAYGKRWRNRWRWLFVKWHWVKVKPYDGP